MSSSILRGDVSEVISGKVSRTESSWRACACTMYKPMYLALYVGMYNVHVVRAVEPRNGRQIDVNTRTCKHLDAFQASLVRPTANLAKQGRNLALLGPNLAVTSPLKPQKTLAFYQKARLARLEVGMPRVWEMHVHAHVHVHSPYRREWKITSPDLANLASGFSSVAARLSPAIKLPATLPHVARSLPRCPSSRTSQATRQWANSGPTARLPEWHSVANCDEIASPQRMGPPQKFDAPLGCGNSRAINHSLFFMSDPMSPVTISQRIAL
jgi:hypothetical protein